MYTIRIEADGSIYPATAPISTSDNVTYTLTGDVDYPTYLGIDVERNNIVVNGNGHEVQGDTMNDNNDGINMTNLSNVTIENTNVESFHWGIELFDCANCHVSKNDATGNLVGIGVGFSTHITISGNDATINGFVGMEVGDYSSNNFIVANDVEQNGFVTPGPPVEGGIFVDSFSNNNTVKENNITGNLDGMYLGGSSNTVIYHNNFEDNSVQVYTGVYGNGSANAWNEAYPSGGNYWSDYLTRYPNASRIDGSGVWNTPYVIGVNNTDYYPLVKLWRPLSVAISPSSAILDVGQRQTFTSNVSGGALPYRYQWCLDGVAVSGANSSTWVYTPTEAESQTVFVKIVDSVGTQVTSNTTAVKVNEALSVGVLPSSATLDVGQSQTLNSTVSGGTSPYSYQWYVNGTAVSGATGPTWTYKSTSAGSYIINLRATDSAAPTANAVASNIATFTVDALPSVTVSPSSTMMDVGQSKTFTSNVTGGTAPYKYQWYLNGTAVSGAMSSSWTLTPTFSRSYTVYVNVTDNLGVGAKSNVASVTVNPVLSATVSPVSVTLDVGQSQIFTANAIGGTPPYSYRWYLNGTLISGVTGSTWTFNPSAPGSHTVYVNVTDNVGASLNSNAARLTVNAATSVSITPTSVTLDVGQSKNFTATVFNGTSPYSYQWYLNGTAVSGAVGSSWTFKPSSSASYTVFVKVTDAASAVATSNTASVTVNSPISVTIIIAIVVVIVAAVIVGASVIMLRRRKRTRAGDQSQVQVQQS
jgi:parallel beta-helix repeat protein